MLVMLVIACDRCVLSCDACVWTFVLPVFGPVMLVFLGCACCDCDACDACVCCVAYVLACVLRNINSFVVILCFSVCVL